MGKVLLALAVFLALSTIGLLVSTIILATKDEKTVEVDVGEAEHIKSKAKSSFFASTAVNKCEGAKLPLANKDCIHVPGPQAGGNVTRGFKGQYNASDADPNLAQYWESKMCPVNVHWHLGTEHYSVGEYDENGDGPHGTIAVADDIDTRKLASDEDVRGGFRCHHYDAEDSKFTKEYDWKHCKNMEVGETYEVHWPHSAVGSCGTANQYQTPFYDGVFCNLDMPTLLTLKPQDIASAVGVQGQIFTIVNDEKYFYPDLMRGMIVDKELDMGKDVTYYTGSTTGTTRSNKMCSSYAPITWQVDRKCHMISASSFDKLCFDMKMQRDDMDDDLHAHGSRELVKHSLVADNQVYDTRRNLWADGDGKLHADEHYEDNRKLHEKDHDYERDHHEPDYWF